MGTAGDSVWAEETLDTRRDRDKRPYAVSRCVLLLPLLPADSGWSAGMARSVSSQPATTA